MDAKRTDFWFPVKTHGFGWGLPVKWQGWAVLLVYFALVVWGITRVDTKLQPLQMLVYLLALTGVLTAIIWWKGERPVKWRWGGK